MKKKQQEVISPANSSIPLAPSCHSFGQSKRLTNGEDKSGKDKPAVSTMSKDYAMSGSTQVAQGQTCFEKVTEDRHERITEMAPKGSSPYFVKKRHSDTGWYCGGPGEGMVARSTIQATGAAFLRCPPVEDGTFTKSKDSTGSTKKPVKSRLKSGVKVSKVDSVVDLTPTKSRNKWVHKCAVAAFSNEKPTPPVGSPAALALLSCHSWPAAAMACSGKVFITVLKASLKAFVRYQS